MKLVYQQKNNQYQTLRQALIQEFHLSNRMLVKLKKAKKIYLNGQFTYLATPIQENDLIEAVLDFPEKSEQILPNPIQLHILYEDDAFIAIDKPPQMPVHPSFQHFTDTLANGLQFYYQENHIETKIRPINRFDRNTSGIVLFAKNEYIQEQCIQQMANHLFQKEYIALLEGHVEPKEGQICAPIARKAESIIERCVDPNGDPAITKYQVLKYYPTYTLVKIQLLTGRTHQIRVHSQWIKHPILGDTLYGNASPLIERQALHAIDLSFIHPVTKNKLSIHAPVPADIEKLL